ncbi:MAG: glycosyltransferase family 4 protein [Isosphaeraceae bacterium]|nr:glycosyltransferase family 4 protein [Isosphaeraceae bacterium]
MNRRILFVSHSCYLDDSNGAAVASRSMMQALARRGYGAEVLSGTVLDLGVEVDPPTWLAGRGEEDPAVLARSWDCDVRGIRTEREDLVRLTVGGVPVSVHAWPSALRRNPDAVEGEGFLGIFEAILARHRPDLVAGYGGTWLMREIFSRARARGIATAFFLHNFNYSGPEPFADVDAVCVPSLFAAEHYRASLGLDCVVLPNFVDRDPAYLTFVNPSPEKGVWAFARIAEQLGRSRPDIPILVVEGRGTEATLASCGIDLRAGGNVFVMSRTRDPRRFWRRTRICLLPSLWWENQPLVAIEAMMNGIPVIGSDRGGIPETLGDAGYILPLPDRLTPSTRSLPEPDEVADWVDAVVRLWDDREFLEDRRGRSLSEARRWDESSLMPRYDQFFGGLHSRPKTRSEPQIA